MSDKKKRVFVGHPKKLRRKRWFVQKIGKEMPKMRQARRGNWLSKLLRVVFELKFIRTLMGSTVVVVFLLLNLIPQSVGGSFGLIHDEQSPEDASVIATNTQKGIQSPLSRFKINQGFWFGHKGVDMDAEIGDPIKPVSAGIVESVEYLKYAYGYHVIINHGSGFKSLYAHMSKVLVKPGDVVTQDTVIGLAGSTGWSTGPHLHLEFTVDGELVNPLVYLPEEKK